MTRASAVAPGPAYLALIAAPAASIDADGLWVSGDRLEVDGAHTFMLPRIETGPTRDGWAALADAGLGPLGDRTPSLADIITDRALSVDDPAALGNPVWKTSSTRSNRRCAPPNGRTTSFSGGLCGHQHVAAAPARPGTEHRRRSMGSYQGCGRLHVRSLPAESHQACVCPAAVTVRP